MDIGDAGRTLGGPESFKMTIPVFPDRSDEYDDEEYDDEEYDLDDAEEIADFGWSEPGSWMGGSGGSRLYRLRDGVYRAVSYGDDEQMDDTIDASSDAAAISSWVSRQDAAAALALTLETFDPSAFPDPEEEDEPEDGEYTEPHTADRVADALHQAPAGVSLAIGAEALEELRALMTGDYAYGRVVSVMRDPLGDPGRAFVAASEDMSLLDFLTAQW